jgi:cephalosporin-C deacetylase
MPLMFDMPLEKLRTYKGCNPKPDDFDEFWDAGLAELAGTEPKPELIPAEFQTAAAECFHLYFRGTGGARIYAKYARPRKKKGKHPAILSFHGYSGSSGNWINLLPYVAEGYSIAALDCRGQGGLSEDVGGVTGWTLRGHIVRGLHDSPDRLLFRHIFLDTAQLARVVMNQPEVDPERMGACGGSQGGGLTLACVALVPQIRLAAPTFPFLCDYKRVWDMDLAKDAYMELHEWFRRFDPLHEREDETFRKLGYVDVQFLCPRIKAEVVMAVSLLDQICPPSTQFAAYNKITSKKALRIYPDFRHEDLPGNGDAVFQFMMGMKGES